MIGDRTPTGRLRYGLRITIADPDALDRAAAARRDNPAGGPA